MRQWLRKVSGLGKARKGQTTAEYAIIVALVAVSSIAIIVLFGDQVRQLFAVSAVGVTGGAPQVQTASPSTSDVNHRISTSGGF